MNKDKDLLKEEIKKSFHKNVFRVFVSSTFSDTQEERDVFTMVVLPQWSKISKLKNIHIQPVDLRWGLTLEQSSQGLVTKICLQEIDKCRPFFVGFIGDRCGWIPDRTKKSDWNITTAKEYPFVSEFPSASVTELELRYAYGLHSNRIKPPCTPFLYERVKQGGGPLNEKLTITIVKESAEYTEKQNCLKDFLRKQLPVKPYTTRHELECHLMDDFNTYIRNSLEQLSSVSVETQFGLSRLYSFVASTAFQEAENALLCGISNTTTDRSGNKNSRREKLDYSTEIKDAQAAAGTASLCQKEGWLEKEGGKVKTIKKRWFTLNSAGLLQYWTGDDHKAKLKGTIFIDETSEIFINNDEPSSNNSSSSSSSSSSSNSNNNNNNNNNNNSSSSGNINPASRRSLSAALSSSPSSISLSPSLPSIFGESKRKHSASSGSSKTFRFTLQANEIVDDSEEKINLPTRNVTKEAFSTSVKSQKVATGKGEPTTLSVTTTSSIRPISPTPPASASASTQLTTSGGSLSPTSSSATSPTSVQARTLVMFAQSDKERQDWIDAIKKVIESMRIKRLSSCPVCLFIGLPGLGKSTALLKLEKEASRLEMLWICHYVSITAQDTTLEAVLTNMSILIKHNLISHCQADPKVLTFELEQDPIIRFHLALDELAKSGKRAVVVIDGASQMANPVSDLLSNTRPSRFKNIHPGNLEWLPSNQSLINSWKGKLKLIISFAVTNTLNNASATPVNSQQDIWLSSAKRMQSIYNICEMRFLNTGERTVLIKKTMNLRGKSLTDEQQKKLIECDITGNPLCLITLVQELCYFGYFDHLDTHIDNLLKLTNISLLLESSLNRILSMSDYTKDYLVCLFCSQIGLTEAEMIQTVHGDVGWTKDWSIVYNALSESFLISSNGRLVFFHHELRVAVDNLFLHKMSKEDINTIRKKIAACLKQSIQKIEDDKRLLEITWTKKTEAATMMSTQNQLQTELRIDPPTMEEEITLMVEVADQLFLSESWTELREWLSDGTRLIKMYGKVNAYITSSQYKIEHMWRSLLANDSDDKVSPESIYEIEYNRIVAKKLTSGMEDYLPVVTHLLTKLLQRTNNKSIEFLLAAFLAVSLRSRDIINLASSYSYLASYYQVLEKYDVAIQNLKKAQETLEEVSSSNRNSISMANLNINNINNNSNNNNVNNNVNNNNNMNNINNSNSSNNTLATNMNNIASKQEFTMKKNSTLVRIMTELSVIYKLQGLCMEAYNTQKLGLDISEKLPKKDGSAIGLINMAEILCMLKKYADSLTNCQKALSIIEGDVALHHYKGQAMLVMGKLYKDQGKLDDSYNYYQKALTAAIDKDDLISSAAYENLALLQFSKAAANNRQVTQSEELEIIGYLQKALDLRKKELPKEHTLIAITLTQIARIYCILEKYTEAKDFYLQALQVRKNKMQHSDKNISTDTHGNRVATVKLVLEMVQSRCFPLSDVALYFDYSLGLLTFVGPTNEGPSHKSVSALPQGSFSLELAELYNTFGDWNYDLFKFDDALFIYNQCIEMREKCANSTAVTTGGVNEEINNVASLMSTPSSANIHVSNISGNNHITNNNSNNNSNYYNVNINNNLNNNTILSPRNEIDYNFSLGANTNNNNSGENMLSTELLYLAYYKKGLTLFHLCHYEESLEFIKKAKKHLDTKSNLYISCSSVSADIYFKLRVYDKAIKHCKRAFDYSEKKNDLFLLAACRFSLAQLYRKLPTNHANHDFKLADTEYEQCLVLRNTAIGSSVSNNYNFSMPEFSSHLMLSRCACLAQSFLGKGDLQRCLNKHNEASQYYTGAERLLLKILEKVGAFPYLSMSINYLLAITYNKQAKSLVCQQKYPLALQVYHSARSKFESCVGLIHPKVASVCANIGHCHVLKDEKSEEAIKNFQQALDIREKCFSKNHYLCANSCYDIGKVLFHQKVYNHARPYVEQAQKIMQATKVKDDYLSAFALQVSKLLEDFPTLVQSSIPITET